MERSISRTASSMAAAVVVVAIMTTACAAGPSVPSATLTPRDSSMPAPSVVQPSTAASASPSPTAAPLIWTTASLKEDWPAPVRTEPAGPATIVPILYTRVVICPAGSPCHSDLKVGSYVDAAGDTGSALLPWVDIDGVGFCGTSCLSFGLAGRLPVVGPTEQWMAYGAVFDTDRDGIADWRYGVDNMPVDGSVDTPDNHPHRAWRTNLHTGRTESAAGAPYGLVGKAVFDTYYPSRWNFGEGVAGGMKLNVPFYVWASEIKDGRVVGTDYAPSVGWLLPSSNAKP